MAYCTVQDVEAYYLGKSFNCDDWLENIEVDMFIEQEAAFINAHIQNRYTLPITNANDLMILKIINEKLVVGTIDGIFREKDDDGKFDRQRNMRKEAMDMLTKISKGEIDLNGTEQGAVIKFNKVDSDGNTVSKRFKEADIEPNSEVIDRERRTIIRVT